MTRELTVMFSDLHNDKSVTNIMACYFDWDELERSEARARRAADRAWYELRQARLEKDKLEQERDQLRTLLDNLHYIYV